MATWPQIFFAGGLLAVVMVAAQGVLLTAGLVRRSVHAQRQRGLEEALLAERIRSARKQRLAGEGDAQAWSGWRKFQVRRKVFEDEGREVCSFELSPHDGKSIAAFRPGQFLTFSLDVPGEAKPIVRCYSLSDSPRQDHYRVTIKRAPAPARASSYFLNEVRQGRILDVRAPSGPFCLDMTKNTPVVLIGSGVGVTPMLSMLNAIAEAGSPRETWFYYGVRNRAEHIMPEHLSRIAREHPNIHVRVCYSRPRQSDQVGADYQVRGRVGVDLLKKELPSNNYDFFFCGPTAMMDDLKAGLKDWGVPDERIHFEDFSPPREAANLDPAEASGPPITFRRSGKTVNWHPKAKNLLEFALANDVSIEAGCWIGNCGTCQRAIVAGQVEYAHTPDYPCEEKTCLTCCCVPAGPMEIDA